MLFGLLSTKAKFDGDNTEYIETEQNEYPVVAVINILIWWWNK